MQPIHLEGQLFDLGGDGTCEKVTTCGSAKNSCKLFAFILPFIIVILTFTVLNWLDTPLFTLASVLCALSASVLPGLLAGTSGFVLYVLIKVVKRRLRAVSSAGQAKQLPVRD
jgi:hypothetical protein